MATPMFETIAADVKSTFGQTAQPNEHPTQRDEIMSFRMNGVSVNFNLNAYWDAVAGEYKEPVPAISLGYNKKYCNLPTDADMLKEMGQFFNRLSEACKGLPARDTKVIHADVANANKMLEKYKAA